MSEAECLLKQEEQVRADLDVSCHIVMLYHVMYMIHIYIRTVYTVYIYFLCE